ncbi:MAG: hypothetical protein AAF701_10475 [Pseudomonadota bacterium]
MLLKTATQNKLLIPMLLDEHIYSDALVILGKDFINHNIVHNLLALGDVLGHVHDHSSAPEMADKIHKALGPCGIIGAVALYQSMAKLETLLRSAPDYAPKQAEQCRADLQETLYILQTLSPSSQISTPC